MKNAQVPARSLLPRPASGKTEAAAEALSQKLGDRYRHCACAASLLYLQKGLWLRLMTGAPVPPAIACKLLGQSCQSYPFSRPASLSRPQERPHRTARVSTCSPPRPPHHPTQTPPP